MPTSFPYIVLRLFTFPFLLLSSLQNTKYITFAIVTFCYHYHYYHITFLLNTLLQILSYPGVVELTTQLLILENILWLPLCRINKLGLNTLPSKTVVIPYTCGLSTLYHEDHGATLKHKCGKGIVTLSLLSFISFLWASLASFIFCKVRRLIPTCEGIIASIILSSHGTML